MWVDFSDIRSVPVWLAQAYIEELGGVAMEDGCYAGEGWTARVYKLDNLQIGSCRIGRIRIDIEGDPETVDKLKARLDKKLLRGGG